MHPLFPKSSIYSVKPLLLLHYPSLASSHKRAFAATLLANLNTGTFQFYTAGGSDMAALLRTQAPRLPARPIGDVLGSATRSARPGLNASDATASTPAQSVVFDPDVYGYVRCGEHGGGGVPVPWIEDSLTACVPQVFFFPLSSHQSHSASVSSYPPPPGPAHIALCPPPSLA